MPWTAETEARLFSGCLQVLDYKLNKEDFTKLADFMDGEFSVDAIRQHVQKKLAKGIISSSGGSSSGAAGKVPSTPVKGTSKSSKSKRGKTTNVEDNNDDDEETPTMKKRASPRKNPKTPSYKEDSESDMDDKLTSSPSKKVKKEPELHTDLAAQSFFSDDSLSQQAAGEDI